MSNPVIFARGPAGLFSTGRDKLNEAAAKAGKTIPKAGLFPWRIAGRGDLFQKETRWMVRPLGAGGFIAAKAAAGARTEAVPMKGVVEWMNRKQRFAAVCFAALMAFPLGWGTPARALERPDVGPAPNMLAAVGHTVGLKLFSEGILVVGISELETKEGQTVVPAKAAGLKVGDLILRCNGVDVESTEHFQDLVRLDEDGVVDLQVRRGGQAIRLTAESVTGADGVRRLGAWVRDSLAGIGTMTFYDPVSGVFGALGHGVNDTDTDQLLALDSGAIMSSTVKAVKPGRAGDPGELKGNFDLTADLGSLYANTDQGVFGTISSCGLVEDLELLPVAAPGQVRKGEAVILSNISGDAVEAYQVQLSRLDLEGGSVRNMVVRVTDQRLLEVTGGIVQGMSGSPILQDGRIVGAVTHVMVDDPTCGYGIYIGNMLKQAYH